MTIVECMQELSLVDNKYSREEDKNYFLVHKMMELLTLIEDENLEALKDEIFKKYTYNSYSSFLKYICIMSKQDIPSINDLPENPHINKVGIVNTNIIDFYNSYDENLIRYIKGHLFLEFAMNTIIKKALTLSTKNKTFSNKIDLLFENSLLSGNEKDLLKALNKERNEIAHNLNYILTFDILFNLVKLSTEAGVDFSDNTIYENKNLSQEWYGIDGIVNELFPNIFCHLFYENEQYFENNEILKFIC